MAGIGLGHEGVGLVAVATRHCGQSRTRRNADRVSIDDIAPRLVVHRRVRRRIEILNQAAIPPHIKVWAP